MRNEICTLIGMKADKSTIGQITEDIYCEKKSSTRAEFYGAYAVGLRPKFVLEIDPYDWEMVAEQLEKGSVPTIVSYRGVEYTVLRSYQTNESAMELTVG